MDALVSDIITRIGHSEQDDYILDLAAHRQYYQESIPTLSIALGSSELATFVAEYHAYDSQAIEARKIYETYTNRGRLFTFLTAVFSALLVVLGGWTLPFIPYDEFIQHLVITFSLGGAASSALASVYLLITKNSKLFATWMKKRAMAEEFRLFYFSKVIQPSDTTAALTPEQALIRLEYFRRYQLDIQLNYYTSKSSQLYQKSNQTIMAAAWIAGGVAFLDGLASAFGIVEGNTTWVLLGGLALIGNALSSMISNKELTEQNERNATRYEHTRKVLIKLSAKLDEIRRGLLTGNFSLLSGFVEAVHEPLHTEHLQWLEHMEQTHSAVAKLDRMLKSVGT